MPPLLVDLFCGLGGASRGYVQAGFRVIGIDKFPQPDYPYDFIQSDVFDVDVLALGPVVVVHASPPCQHGAAITRGTNKHLRHTYPDLYEPTKDLLEAIGLPYVIENPDTRADVVLCGEMFGLGVQRHRKFELGKWSMTKPGHKPHRGKVRGWNHGVWQDGPYVAVYGKGGGKATLAEAKSAMGIDWSDDYDQITEAIPPQYTEFLGRGLMEYLRNST